MKITPPNAYTILQDAERKIKKLGRKPSAKDYKEIKELAQKAKAAAEKELQDSYKNKPFKARIDKFLDKIFEKFAKTFKYTPNNKTANLSKSIINAVLIGNILKDLATGIISTSQSFTNLDLTKEKRLFVGSYDIMACITTVIISYLFGPMAVDKIMSGYKKALKALDGHPKQAFIVAGLSTFTSLVLQSIVAKRMLAPAISTPLAGKLKNKIEKHNNIQNRNVVKI